MHSYFVLTAFALLIVFFILQIARIRGEGFELVGKPSIDRYYFFSGKVTLFTTWVLFCLKAINPKLVCIQLPFYLNWFAVALLWAGILLVLLATLSLGKSLRVGLPQTQTALQSRGVYRLSRNPLYLGVFTIAAGSCIYFPDLINVSFAIFGIYTHHQIIKGEEQFLKTRFGAEWENYAAHVRRYL
ncbi:MAG: methyltransferase [Bacteroidota bacterium]